MKSQFTKELLFHLRNHVPIQHLITEVLKLNTNSLNGTFHFECPLCHGFNTATNPKTTNLARCFACLENFNPIDLVIRVCSLPFPKAVSFLQDQYKISFALPPPQQPPPLPKIHPFQPHNSPGAALTKLGDILAHYKIAPAHEKLTSKS